MEYVPDVGSDEEVDDSEGNDGELSLGNVCGAEQVNSCQALNPLLAGSC